MKIKLFMLLVVMLMSLTLSAQQVIKFQTTAQYGYLCVCGVKYGQDSSNLEIEAFCSANCKILSVSIVNPDGSMERVAYRRVNGYSDLYFIPSGSNEHERHCGCTDSRGWPIDEGSQYGWLFSFSN